MTKKKTEPLVGPEDDGSKSIIAIEYDQQGIPCTVETSGGSYEFADTPYGLYWHGSGYGLSVMEYSIGMLCEPVPPHKVWLADGVVLTKWVKDDTYSPISRTEALERGYELIDDPLDMTGVIGRLPRKKGRTANPFDVGEESPYGIVWCTVCKTHLPDEPENYCQHLFDGGEIGCCLGTGCSEIDLAKGHKESFFVVLEKTGLSGPLRRAMINGDYSFWNMHNFGCQTIHACLDGVNYGKRFTDDLTDEQEEDMSIGVGWLRSLETGKTRECELLTVKWIDEWLGVRGDKKTG